jgi:hypothetical protein
MDPSDIFTLHNRFILGLKNVVEGILSKICSYGWPPDKSEFSMPFNYISLPDTFYPPITQRI